VERKTRFHDRARQPKPKKVKTADQIENEHAAEAPTAEESAAQKTQSKPLGLAGDTTKKAPKPKSDKKTRYSDEANKSKQAAPPPPQTSTPSPLATPGTVPAPADNGSNPTPPATQPQP
jgi:peptidyl-prolyl cis-trans isomerase SurA